MTVDVTCKAELECRLRSHNHQATRIHEALITVGKVRIAIDPRAIFARANEEKEDIEVDHVIYSRIRT